MLTVSQKRKCCQKEEFLRHAATICPWVPFGMIGKICRMLAQKHRTTPPNRQSPSRTSRKVRSAASNTLQRPHPKRPKQFLEASGLCAGILQVESSTSISTGILNLECAVVPLSRNVAAIPDDATESAT